ncbi:tripartite tricarboxylate transporter substrate binding protein [Angustibacter sp. Root456]|uniref:Bug family tripartite tricarboxylate transporter substrate binding protein n=1 Tax=Angustibacter sp. Root456 TaxID=1736539 RepID=UPI0006FE52BF|nr:tripartite tricarboxylate transporter substrate binding protein [Angustibacter sp. Root456]KQX61974.1 C4-dicarboxylate ABC transporter substrate-binding protein [Angustibacter sp. Root456]
MTQHVLTLTGSGPRRPRSVRRVATAAVAAVAALGLVACSSSGEASASGKDSKALARLDIMAPAAPGGGWDGTARAMGASIESAELAKSVTVKNVAGAGGTVGLAQLANDKSDHSLMVMGLVMVGAVATNQSQATLKDVTPIARLTAEDEVIVVPASSPYKTIKDLGDALKAKGRAVTITGGSAGGTDHIVAGLFAKAAGVAPADLNYIPFSGGGESLAALLGNKVQAGISGVSEYAEQIKAGKLRALAVAGPQRVADVDAPTLKESGYDVELTNWRGVVAPGGVSDETKQRLVKLVTDMHDTQGWKDALQKNGWQDTFLAGDDFDSFITKEISTTEGVLKDLGLVK